MLMIRPENPNFVFPAGRYGLVIKGQAYDFTVAGPVTEPAQCLKGHCSIPNAASQAKGSHNLPATTEPVWP